VSLGRFDDLVRFLELSTPVSFWFQETDEVFDPSCLLETTPPTAQLSADGDVVLARRIGVERAVSLTYWDGLEANLGT
jgi:hypothetical protein